MYLFSVGKIGERDYCPCFMRGGGKGKTGKHFDLLGINISCIEGGFPAFFFTISKPIKIN